MGRPGFVIEFIVGHETDTRMAGWVLELVQAKQVAHDFDHLKRIQTLARSETSMFVIIREKTPDEQNGRKPCPYWFIDAFPSAANIVAPAVNPRI